MGDETTTMTEGDGARTVVTNRLAPALTAILLVQLVAMLGPLSARGYRWPPPNAVLAIVASLTGYLSAALALRTLAARLRRSSLAGSWRRYLVDLAWLLVGMAVLTVTYTWVKVLLPVFRTGLWDAELAAADSALCLGVNPNVALLAIFELGPRWAARGLDLFYAAFVPTMLAGTTWFLADRRRPQRLAFGWASASLWTLGLWGYMAMPALGPALAFDDLWREVAGVFPTAAATEAALMANYQRVVAMSASSRLSLVVTPTFGVAAMPSLHVAAQCLLMLWAFSQRSRLRVVFLVATLLTFIGSVATGWHYLLDSVAGLAVAALAFLVGRVILRRAERPVAEPSPASGEAERPLP